MSLIKNLFRWGLYLSYLILIVVVIIEVIFRVLPVSDSLMIQAVNEDEPILHFKENRSIKCFASSPPVPETSGSCDEYLFITNFTHKDGPNISARTSQIYG